MPETLSPAPRETLIPEAPPYWLRYAGHLVQFGTLDPLIRAMAVAATAAVVVGLLALTLPLTALPSVHALTALMLGQVTAPLVFGGLPI